MMETDTSQLFQSLMGQKERLLWSGRPTKFFYFSWADIPITLFMIPWTGFAVFWVYMASQASWWFASFGFLFIGVGLYMLIFRHFYTAYRRSFTYFAVTNERVMVMYRSGSTETRSFPIAKIENLSITERSDGSGDLTFNEKGTIAVDGFTVKNRKSLAVPPSLDKFESIPNVREVYRLILSKQSNASGERGYESF